MYKAIPGQQKDVSLTFEAEIRTGHFELSNEELDSKQLQFVADCLRYSFLDCVQECLIFQFL